jgi:hypothetical protein
MILFSGVDSILESIYTGIPLTDRMANATVLVNPDTITYLSKKICILTKNYDPKKAEILVKNENTVISRVTQENMKGITLDPYLPKLFENIVWNGDYVRLITPETYDNCIEFTYNSVTNILSYPKPIEYFGEVQENGEINSMGYILYQLGENIFPDTIFTDLDIVKQGKGIF